MTTKQDNNMNIEEVRKYLREKEAAQESVLNVSGHLIQYGQVSDETHSTLTGIFKAGGESCFFSIIVPKLDQSDATLEDDAKLYPEEKRAEKIAEWKKSKFTNRQYCLYIAETLINSLKNPPPIQMVQVQHETGQ